MEDIVRIPPEKFGGTIKRVAKEQVRLKYENMIDEELGYVISVVDVNVAPVGRILPGDGSTYHKVKFQLLTFYPELQEIVMGEIVEITDFGAFIRIGPEDALVHVSQIIDDFISFDEKHGVLSGKETRRTLSKGDRVKARIIAVGFPKGGVSGKIGLTMRQPFLGKFEWIEEALKKEKEEKD
jgi:DNA-directed RNA polymerase subunit E'